MTAITEEHLKWVRQLVPINHQIISSELATQTEISIDLCQGILSHRLEIRKFIAKFVL